MRQSAEKFTFASLHAPAGDAILFLYRSVACKTEKGCVHDGCDQGKNQARKADPRPGRGAGPAGADLADTALYSGRPAVAGRGGRADLAAPARRQGGLVLVCLPGPRRSGAHRLLRRLLPGRLRHRRSVGGIPVCDAELLHPAAGPVKAGGRPRRHGAGRAALCREVSRSR